MIKLHHIGLIVSDIKSYEKGLIYESKIDEIYDPIQKAKLALYSNFGDSKIELIQPIDETSFTWNFMKNNKNPFHHLCYEVKNLNDLELIKKKFRLIPILGPIPALLFGGKQVAFFYSRNKIIIEILIFGSENSSTI